MPPPPAPGAPEAPGAPRSSAAQQRAAHQAPSSEELNPYAHRVRGTRPPSPLGDAAGERAQVADGPQLVEFAQGQAVGFPSALRSYPIAELELGAIASVVAAEAAAGRGVVVRHISSLKAPWKRVWVSGEELLGAGEQAAARLAALIAEQALLEPSGAGLLATLRALGDPSAQRPEKDGKAAGTEDGKESGRPQWVVLLEDLSRLSERDASQVLGQLRAFCEAAAGRPVSVRLVLIERAGLEQIRPDVSAFYTADITQLRIGRFGQKELEELVASSRGCPGRPSPFEEHAAELAAAVLQAGGGQPLLSQALLSGAWSRLAGGQSVGVDAVGEAVSQAAARLARARPPAVRDWQLRLAEAYVVRPRVRSILGELLAARDDVAEPDAGWLDSEDARLLFVMGWIWWRGEGRDRRWGLASTLHREWAREVTRQPARFLPRRGAP